jgi:hypothetical protein
MIALPVFAAEVDGVTPPVLECPHDAEQCTTPPTPIRLRSIGIALQSVVGLGGSLRNAAPAATTSFVLTLQPGLGLRWYPQGGWENVNGANGFRIDMLRFGVPVRLSAIQPIVLEVEPIVGVPFDYVVGNQFSHVFAAVLAEVGVRAYYKSFFALVVPVGLEARWLNVLSQTGVGGASFGMGLGWIFSLELGVRL